MSDEVLTADLEVFDLDVPFIGRCSYPNCEFAESTDNNDMGTVWLNGIAYRFHPQCQRLWAQPPESEPEENEEEEEV